MALDNLGLTLAMISLIREYQDRFEIIWTLAPVTPDEIPDEIAICFFRVLQESITNIVKHAGASRITVDLKKNDGVLTMKVEDNGRGMAEAGGRLGGLGLIGMRERAELCGGSLAVESKTGKGFLIVMKVPING